MGGLFLESGGTLRWRETRQIRFCQFFSHDKQKSWQTLIIKDATLPVFMTIHFDEGRTLMAIHSSNSRLQQSFSQNLSNVRLESAETCTEIDVNRTAA